MFGLSWGQIIIIVLIGMFVLGPERIPVAVQWTVNSLKKVRTMAQGAQAQLNKEIGPELEEMRRQIAELQSLKEMQELRNLRDLHPRKLIGKGLLGPEGSTGSAGGVAGFLGLDRGLLDPPVAGNGATNGATNGASNGAVQEPAEVAAGGVDHQTRRDVRPLSDGERPPFDPDGT